MANLNPTTTIGTIDVYARQRTRTRVAGSLSSSSSRKSSHSKTLAVSTILLGLLFLPSAVEAFQFHDVRQATAKHNHRFIFTSSTSTSSRSRLQSTPPGGSTEQQQDPNSNGDSVFPVVKSDQEWKEILTPDQYYILRKEGTETPGASVLNKVSVEKNGGTDAGTFCCAGCQNPLFLASSKYDSGTGWPSFFAPVTASATSLNTDYKLIVPRTECVCSQCGGHLGHVFEDGPEPTGQRYCMNGAAMQFYRDSERPELAEQVSRMATEDPFKLSPSQALPAALINVIIGGIFFNAFLSSGKSTPIDFLTLLPATYYGFLAAKSIAKLMA